MSQPVGRFFFLNAGAVEAAGHFSNVGGLIDLRRCCDCCFCGLFLCAADEGKAQYGDGGDSSH